MLIEKRLSWTMFNRIAPTYDRANRWLSLGIDRYWRRRLVAQIPNKIGPTIVDLGTGTGDVIIALARRFRDGHLIGLDPAEDMLKIATLKSAKFGGQIELKVGSADEIPLDSESIDALTMAFAIRNVPDVPRALQEMCRVIKPSGIACILEFSVPHHFLIKRLYLFYFRHILPVLGGLISGDRAAYRYLNVSVEAFPYGQEFAKLMTAAGFSEVTVIPMTFGIASLYVGKR